MSSTSPRWTDWLAIGVIAGRPVLVEHDDLDGRARRQRHAGAVAVVGRGEGDVVGARLGVAGRPAQEGRLRVEASPRRAGSRR